MFLSNLFRSFYDDGSCLYEFDDDDAPLVFLKHHYGSRFHYILRGTELTIEPFHVTGQFVRHPENWGIVLVLPASVWANFEMPPRGTDDFLDKF